MKNKSFTLAEVLITLTIIGVIAALTIPTLMKKFDNIILEKAITKNYAYINQMFKIGYAQTGCGDFECYYTTISPNKKPQEFLENTFPKGIYLGYQYDSIKVKTSTNLFYFLNGTHPTSYIDFSGSGYSNFNIQLQTGAILAMHDTAFKTNVSNWTTYISSSVSNNGHLWLYIPTKNNKYTIGKNVFLLRLNNDGRVTPWNTYSKSNPSTCDPSVKKTTEQDACLSRIIQDGWKINY